MFGTEPVGLPRIHKTSFTPNRDAFECGARHACIRGSHPGRGSQARCLMTGVYSAPSPRVVWVLGAFVAAELVLISSLYARSPVAALPLAALADVTLFALLTIWWGRRTKAIQDDSRSPVAAYIRTVIGSAVIATAAINVMGMAGGARSRRQSTSDRSQQLLGEADARRSQSACKPRRRPGFEPGSIFVAVSKAGGPCCRATARVRPAPFCCRARDAGRTRQRVCGVTAPAPGASARAAGAGRARGSSSSLRPAGAVRETSSRASSPWAAEGSASRTPPGC